MTEEKQAQAEDSSTVAPPSDNEPKIQFADEDSPEVEPSGNEQEVAEYFLGDYKTREDAEKAIQETKRAMHEAKEEAAAYRKALEIAGQEKTPEQTVGFGQPDPTNMKAQLEEQLQSDPVGTIMNMMQFSQQQFSQQREKQGQQRMTEFQNLASQPEYADVASQVLQSLSVNPNTDIEKEFLKAKVQHMASTNATGRVMDQANAQRMHVESGQSRQPENVIRVEIDDDARKVQKAFGMSEEEFRSHQRNIAKNKLAGMSGGKAPVAFDDWMAQRGANNG